MAAVAAAFCCEWVNTRRLARNMRRNSDLEQEESAGRALLPVDIGLTDMGVGIVLADMALADTGLTGMGNHWEEKKESSPM
jgi:hypothetical protein